MRATEFMHFMNRTDIGLGANPKEQDYTHYTPRMYAKRRRYEYQKMLRSQNASKSKDKKEYYAELIRQYFRRQDENKNARQSKRNIDKNEPL